MFIESTQQKGNSPTKTGESSIIEYNGAHVHIELYNGRVKFDDKMIYLRNRERDLLEYMIAHAEEKKTKEDILDGVWKDVIVDPGSVRVTISMIKSKLPSEYRDIIRHANTKEGRAYILSDTYENEFTTKEERIIDYLKIHREENVRLDELVLITHGHNTQYTKRSLSTIISQLKRKLPEDQILNLGKEGIKWNNIESIDSKAS